MTSVNLTGYTLTFDDEFNSFSWNSTQTPGNGTWDTTYNWGRSIPSNGELETYSDASTGTNPFSIVPSGDIPGHSALDIQAAPSASGGYTSGLITTESSFSQTYGYFSMRAELPQGAGLWPAFWLLPVDKAWPPELDVMEAFGAPNAGAGGSNTIHVGVHSTDAADDNGAWVTLPPGDNISTGFNTYGLMWTPTELTYYINGQEVAQYATPADMDVPMYILANLAVGGSWVGDPTSANDWPANMLIEDIHVYSDAPGAVAATPQAGYTNASVEAAQTTPSISHHWVGTESGGATGGSTPSDLYATAADQTLVGNGGNDVFNVATYGNTDVVENGHGISTVSTWSSFTLPVGISDLSALGNYGHVLGGNAGNNYIYGSNGNDTINGGGGNDIIALGTGQNLVTGGGTGHNDQFVFGALADKNNVITDFAPGHDELDLTLMFQAMGYTGANPIADNHLHLVQAGANTTVVIDPHANGDSASHVVVTLDNVVASSLVAGTDYIWHH
jgi:beta-glucanase (GH16 family)